MLRLDDRDILILEILQAEGRLTKSELAKRINLSNAPCWERLKRLERHGIIEGYGARVRLNRVLDCVTVFVAAELESHRAEDFKRFEEAVAAEPRIVACWALGGGFDFLFQVVTGSIDAYQRLIDRLLDVEIGLKRYFTYIVTKEIKRPDSLPVADLLGSSGVPENSD